MVKGSMGKLVGVFLLSTGLLMVSGCMSLLTEWEMQTTVASQPATPEPEPETEPKIPEQTYHMGERGPAGGLIFFDKGVYSDGWRYLEAAPARWSGSPYDPKAQWGAYPFSMNGAELKNGFGDGLENSEHIMVYNKHLQANRETYEQLPVSEQVFRESHDGSVAAAFCLEASINGFDDWYLPSQDELLLVRNILYNNEQGSFQADQYWSSSMSGDRSGTKVNFWIGSAGGSYTNTAYYVRPVRRF